MRLLSFELPGLSGCERGCGKIELLDGELALELGIIGWRKPPASSERYSGFMARSEYQQFFLFLLFFLKITDLKKS